MEGEDLYQALTDVVMGLRRCPCCCPQTPCRYRRRPLLQTCPSDHWSAPQRTDAPYGCRGEHEDFAWRWDEGTIFTNQDFCFNFYVDLVKQLKKIVNFFTNVNTGRMKVFTESQLRAVPVWSAWRRPGGQTLRLQTFWGNGPPQDWVPHHSSNHPLTNRTTGGRNGQRWLKFLKRINESVWFPGSPLIFGVTQTQVLCDQLGVGMNCAVVMFGAPGTSVGAEEGVMIDTGPPQVFTGFGTRQNHRHFTVLSLTLKEEEQEHKQNRSLVKFYYFVPLHSMK